MKTYRPFKAVTWWHEVLFTGVLIASALVGLIYGQSVPPVDSYLKMFTCALFLGFTMRFIYRSINKRVEKKLDERTYICAIDPVDIKGKSYLSFADVEKDMLALINCYGLNPDDILRERPGSTGEEVRDFANKIKVI